MGATFDKLLGCFLLHKHKQSDIVPVNTPALGMVANGLVGTVPAGYMLEMIVVIETSGTLDMDIALGTTAGGTEISPSELIVKGDNNVIGYNYAKKMAIEPFSVYLTNAVVWTTEVLDVYLLLRKIK
jgi:hypothetical protein